MLSKKNYQLSIINYQLTKCSIKATIMTPGMPSTNDSTAVKKFSGTEKPTYPPKKCSRIRNAAPELIPKNAVFTGFPLFR